MEEQQRTARRKAHDRVEALEATPEQVLAGPSHSQLSKDHPNSPFFGLAVRLATEAVRRLRDAMVDAWDAEAGGTSTPYRFEEPSSDPGAQALHAERERAARESRERGEEIYTRGRELPAATYDLERMRHESAEEIRTVAQAIESAFAAPDAAAAQLDRLNRLVGDDTRVERIRRSVQESIRRAADLSRSAGRAGRQALGVPELVGELRARADRLERNTPPRRGATPSQQGGSEPDRQEAATRIRAVAHAIETSAMAPDRVADRLHQLEESLDGVDDADVQRVRRSIQRLLLATATGSREAGAAAMRTLSVTELVGDLRDIAGRVETARTHEERERTNRDLRAAQMDALRSLDRAPGLPGGFRGAVLLLLDRQIQSTAPTYTGEQRAVLEGRRHVLDNPDRYTLTRSTVTAPSLDDRSPEIRDLLNVSRTIIDHPYQNLSWWRPIVEEFIREHPDQITEEIRARNRGYLVFRQPGQTSGGHDH